MIIVQARASGYDLKQLEPTKKSAREDGTVPRPTSERRNADSQIGGFHHSQWREGEAVAVGVVSKESWTTF
jgi:hypothetical protein